MYIANPLLKTRDKVNKFSSYIPLVSDINDKEGVLMEHYALNRGYKNLKFALILIDGKYYFIDAENAIAEHKYISDNKQFTCPCCYQDLFTRGSHIKRINNKNVSVSCSFNHYKHSEDCEFKTGYNSKYVNDGFGKFSGEKYDHKFIKITTCAIANAGHMYIKIPKSYEIIENEEDYTCKAEINYFTEKIIRAETEKTVLKKDDKTDGLRPDILFYTESGKRIIVEVTVGNGKTVAEYHNRWERVGDTVLEVRLSDNNDIYDSDFYEEDIDFIEQLILSDYEFNDKRVFRYLYSPVLNQARRDVEIRKAKLSDLKKERGLVMEVKKLEKEVKILKSEKNCLLDDVQELEYKRDRLIGEVSMLENEKDDIEKKKTDMIDNAGFELRRIIKELEDKKEELETSITTLHEKNKSIKEEYEQMKLYKDKVTSSSKEVARLERKKLSLLKELDLYQNKLEREPALNVELEKKNISTKKNKEVDTIAELNDRLLEIKEAGLYAENITIKCKAMLFDDKKRLMLYDEVEAIAFHIDKETALPKIAENTQNVLNIGFYINADTKKEEILFLKVIKSEA